MGKRGPRKTPTAILEARGSELVASRANELTPASAYNPDPPAWMNDVERGKWSEMTELLSALRVLTVNDLDALSRYCTTWALWLESRELCMERGMTIESGDKGYMSNAPWFNQMVSCENILTKIGARFGLTPSDRADLNIPKVPDGKVLNAQQKFIDRIQTQK